MANAKSGATPPMIKLMRYEFSEVGRENQRTRKRRDPEMFMDYVEQTDDSRLTANVPIEQTNCNNEKLSCNAGAK